MPSSCACYEYDAYGKVTVRDPNFTLDADGLSDYDNPYLFTGREIDCLDTGYLTLQYNRNRYYSQSLGRWYTNDPLGITPNPQKPNVWNAQTQHTDGVNTYGYTGDNPVNGRDAWGLHIYLKTGNNSGHPINDAFHQNVCVDRTCKQDGKNLACFSFGKIGWMFRFGARITWLGWPSYTLGGIIQKGAIYEADDVGTVVGKKKTTWDQDKAWFRRMERDRVGIEDVYSFGRHNCRKYAQKEFNDAP